MRILLLLLILLSPPAFAEEDKDDTKLPVPRFVSLRSEEVNMRVGPGTRYSIVWVYRKESLPVEIIQEFDGWREIRDGEGTIGWVNKQMLQGKRTAVVKATIAVLRKAPEAHAKPVLRAEAGVIGKLLECDIDWCKMQIDGRKGWINKSAIWGACKKEKF